MKSKDIKLKNWPFDQGARVKLEWIGAPFRYEKDCRQFILVEKLMDIIQLKS